MTMQALPGSALEVIETEFFFQLLMRLLANPSCLDSGRQGAQVIHHAIATWRTAEIMDYLETTIETCSRPSWRM